MMVSMLLLLLLYNDLRFLKNTVGRHELMDSKSSITARINSTSSDERKRKSVLYFCIAVWCFYFDPVKGDPLLLLSI
jgi:hypothetical protein